MGNYSYVGNGKLMTNKGGKIEDEDDIAKIIKDQGVVQSYDTMQGNIAPVNNENVFTGGHSTIEGSQNFGAIEKPEDSDIQMESVIKELTGENNTGDTTGNGGSDNSEGKKVYPEYNTKKYSDVIGTIASSYYPSQEDTPVYDDKYGKSIDAAVKSLAAMNYNDWAQSATYQELVNRYGNAGNLAMQDTIGQMSARTGGMASTYAQSAGQQSYNQYMQALEDAAQSQYAAERNEIQNDIANLRALRSDDLSEFNTKYNLWNADKQYQDTQAEKARQNIIDYLVTYGGNPEDINEDLLTQAGYSNDQLQAFKNAYQTNNEATLYRDALEIGSYDDAKKFFVNNSTANVESIINMLVDNGTLTEQEGYDLYAVYGDHTEFEDEEDTEVHESNLEGVSAKFDSFSISKNAIKYLKACVANGVITEQEADNIWYQYANKYWINKEKKPESWKE